MISTNEQFISSFAHISGLVATVKRVIFEGNIFANALWCDLLRVKILQMVYESLNKITVCLYF